VGSMWVPSPIASASYGLRSPDKTREWSSQRRSGRIPPANASALRAGIPQATRSFRSRPPPRTARIPEASIEALREDLAAKRRGFEDRRGKRAGGPVPSQAGSFDRRRRIPGASLARRGRDHGSASRARSEPEGTTGAQKERARPQGRALPPQEAANRPPKRLGTVVTGRTSTCRPCRRPCRLRASRHRPRSLRASPRPRLPS
jgi:hypothetical protein